MSLERYRLGRVDWSRIRERLRGVPTLVVDVADTKTITKIREAIVERPAAWTKAVRTAPFSTAFELSGDSLSRPPRGFDPRHPLVEDLRRKDFIGIRVLDERTATYDLFLSSFLSASRDGVPLRRFLCEALRLPF